VKSSGRGWRHLRDSLPITLPQILRNREMEKLGAQATPPADSIRAAAERNVHWALIIRQVFQQEKMRVTREEMNRKIATSGSPDENQEERQNWFYTHPESLTEIEYAVMEDKVSTG
jgi:FKBP-type peptidyl-prolyl cis-trans isomerase (trigger factor)